MYMSASLLEQIPEFAMYLFKRIPSAVVEGFFDEFGFELDARPALLKGFDFLPLSNDFPLRLLSCCLAISIY